MAAYIQHLTSLIRQGDGAVGYGDPYEWSATVRWISADRVELIGVDAPMTRQVWRDVMNCMARSGIKHFLIHREGSDFATWRWLKVKSYELHTHSSIGQQPQRESTTAGG